MTKRVGFLLTGGLDVPLGSQFTATAAVNALFGDDTDVGILVGVGYNFSGFLGQVDKFILGRIWSKVAALYS